MGCLILNVRILRKNGIHMAGKFLLGYCRVSGGSLASSPSYLGNQGK